MKCYFFIIPYNTYDKIKPNLVTAEQLKTIGWYDVTDDKIVELNKLLYEFDITTTERIRHFLAQCLHESGNGQWIREGEQDFARGRWKTQEEYEAHYNATQYTYKYRGVGYIQATFDYSYKYFATYMIYKTYPEYNTEFEATDELESILRLYDNAIKKAKENNLDIKQFIDIVDGGTDYVAKNSHYVWTISGIIWLMKGLNNKVDGLRPNDVMEVDKVSEKINPGGNNSFAARREKYETVREVIK